VIVVGGATLPVVIVAVGAAAISSMSLVLTFGGRAIEAARLATAGLLVIAIPVAAVLGPVSDDRRSARDLVEAARLHARPDDTLVRYRTGDRALDWSTGRRWRWAGGEDKVARLRAEGPLLLAGEAEKMRGIDGLEVLEIVVYDGDDWLIGRLSGPTTARPEPGR
jgi:hypothetical protein